MAIIGEVSKLSRIEKKVKKWQTIGISNYNAGTVQCPDSDEEMYEFCTDVTVVDDDSALDFFVGARSMVYKHLTPKRTARGLCTSVRTNKLNKLDLRRFLCKLRQQQTKEIVTHCS